LKLFETILHAMNKTAHFDLSVTYVMIICF